jgi:asparagine synthase (glutamine-hydrolysing)
MCGIVGISGIQVSDSVFERVLNKQQHRGPDSKGVFSSDDQLLTIGHNRLSIIDLSENGNQPLLSQDGRYVIIFNGEVYNYKEIRKSLETEFKFRTNTDTEVVLYSYIKYGKSSLDLFLGMFSFVIFDKTTNSCFAARDRFGVKPFHYYAKGGTLIFASEIKSILASGLVEKKWNPSVWATYFADGRYDDTEDTFYEEIKRLNPGHCMEWRIGEKPKFYEWYNIHSKIKNEVRSENDVMDELLSLLESSINYRFIADVPVGICLSGGLDSSLLLAIIQRIKGKDFPIHAFSFYTNDERYDELPWVEMMVKHTGVKLHPCVLRPNEVEKLSKKISFHMDEPFGGIPALGMSKVFECASENGITVLLDGNGLDEGWAGYEYYQRAQDVDIQKGPVQQSFQQADMKSVLEEDFLRLRNEFRVQQNHFDPVQSLQLRDILQSKIPRSMRFADRNSMAYSLELREPFLDHRIIELGLSQPNHNKINNGQGKWLVRKLASKLLPSEIRSAPKRGVQTPQREWLKDDLSIWVKQNIEMVLDQDKYSWFKKDESIKMFERFKNGDFDNSFFVWQWINFQLLND